MSSDRTIEVFARSSAPPNPVWDLLVDATEWSSWTRIPQAVREREGTTSLDGVGSIRRLGLGRMGSREEVVAFEPPHHFAYVLLTGMPVREYRADVELTPDGSGTLIAWRARFIPKSPALGRPLELFLRQTLSGFARGLARHAARPVAEPPNVARPSDSG